MSLIRKPAEAERESSVRRAAETAIAGGQAVRNAGREIGGRTRRTAGKIAQYYLLGMFTFGALMASSVGAKLLGLTIMAPFWYLALRNRKQPGALPTARARVAPASNAAVELRGVSARSKDAAGVPVSDAMESSFDADAAIARYLASKEAERPQPADLAQAAPPQPQRPVFGKRTT